MHLKTDKVNKKNMIFFCIFLQSPHQVDMKNIVECPREFYADSNALETKSDLSSYLTTQFIQDQPHTF